MSLEARYYLDDSIFEYELERIFKHRFCVGVVEEIEMSQNDPDTKKTSSKNIYRAFLLPAHRSAILTKEDKIRAFRNVCPHRGNELVDIEDMAQNFPRITCRYHSWSFDMKGFIQNKPACKQTCRDKLSKLDLHIVKNVLMLGDAPAITPPKAYLRFNLDRIGVRTSDVEVAANWKLLVSNFNCYYHLISIHPLLAPISRPSDHIHHPPHEWVVHFGTEPLTTTENSPFHTMKGSPSVAYFITWFPNAFMFVLPDHTFMVCVIPNSSSTSTERIILLIDRERANDREYIDGLWNFYTTINTEDLQICEMVQGGLRNRDPTESGGQYVYPYEQCVEEFDKLYLNALNRAKL